MGMTVEMMATAVTMVAARATENELKFAEGLNEHTWNSEPS